MAATRLQHDGHHDMLGPGGHPEGGQAISSTGLTAHPWPRIRAGRPCVPHLSGNDATRELNEERGVSWKLLISVAVLGFDKLGLPHCVVGLRSMCRMGANIRHLVMVGDGNESEYQTIL
jgi:hypothetical protein